MEKKKEKIINSEIVECCVMNCKKQISVDEAIKIKGQYFCGICGSAYYRSALNL